MALKKTIGCTCHDGKYPKWLTTGECKITAQYNAAIKKRDQDKNKGTKKFVAKQGIKRTRIKKLSDKQRVRNAIYSKGKREKFYPEYEENGYVECRMKMKGCTGKAEGGHHPYKKIGDDLFCFSDLIPSCNSCNLRAETHPKEAKALGLIFKKGENDSGDQKGVSERQG